MTKQRPRITLVIFWLTWFSINFYAVMISTLLPAIQQSLLLSISAASLILSVGTWGKAIIRIPIGIITDWLGQKKVIILGITLCSLGILLTSLIKNYVVILILSFISGAGYALYLPTAISHLSEIFIKKRGLYIGIHETAVPLGRAVGSIFAGLALIWGLGWTGSLQIYFILPILGIIIQLAFMKQPPTKTFPRDQQINKKSGLLKLNTSWSSTTFLLVLGATICHFVGESFLGLLTLYWTKDLAFEIATAAFIVGVMRFSGPIGHIVAGYLSDIFGRVRVLIVFTFFFTVFLISSSYLPFGFLLIVSLLLFTALYDGFYPLLFVLISDTTLPGERTKTLGILLAISGIFTAFHLAITGFLAENFGFRIAWIYPIVLSALGCIFVILLKGRIKIITNSSTQE